MTKANEAMVDVIVDVLECVSKDRAFEYGRNCMQRPGAVLARVEDRTDCDEGWACVVYFHPSSNAFGTREQVRESYLGPAAMEAYHAARVEPQEEMSYAQWCLNAYRARRVA